MRRGTRSLVWLTVSVVLAGMVLAPGLPQGGRGLNVRVGDLAFVADAHINADFVDGEVIGEIVTGAKVEAVADRHGLTILEDLQDEWFLFSIPDGRTVEATMVELGSDPDVLSAEPNFLFQAPEVDQRSIIFICGQSSSDFAAQNALDIIRATEARAVADGGGVTVAVIDTGIDADHLAFHRLGQGFDFADDDADPDEEVGGIAFGHGTMVAGLITLMAPQATIMPVRAFTPDGLGRASDVSQAIRYAARRGADVINMSFGMLEKSGPVRSAINFAGRRGAVLIASAGNNNTSVPQYPAKDSRVMAVGATDEADIKAEFSNYGSSLDVCAPGVGVTGPFPGGDYALADGTSFAAAFVSGEAALVLSIGGGEAERVIRETAVNIDELNPSFRRQLGRGRIDVLAAVSFDGNDDD